MKLTPLLAFLIGSSYPVFVSFFLSVQNRPDSLMNYTFKDYSLIAPLYLGLMNVLGLCLFPKNRFVWTGILSGLTVATVATLMDSYNFTQAQWNQYYLRILLKHFFTFNVVIQLLEFYALKK